MRLLTFLIFLLLFSPYTSHATIISPPSQMETMVENAEIIVFGKILKHQDPFGYINDFQILESIKGSLTTNQIIQVKEYGYNDGEKTAEILGDVDYELGSNYLLFLFLDGNGYYRAEMLALSVYKEMIVNNVSALVHPEDILDLCFTAQPVEELKLGYHKKPFLSTLKLSANNSQSWSINNAGVYNTQEHTHTHSHGKSAAGTPPSHCTLVSGNYNQLATTCTNGSPARYENPTFQIKVASGSSSDASLANEIANLTNAATELNNISGLSISLATPLIQTCATAGCTNIFDVVTACNPMELNDIWVFFEDPCNQIPALNNCNGTLGFGGTFTWNAPACHSDGCGNLWRNALKPFFLMNDGAGCVLGGDYSYTALIIHEMLHSINVGHISGTCTGANPNNIAIMNPSICNTNASSNEPNFGITQLDLDCVEWMYDISNDPCNATCSISNVQVGPTCNGTNVDLAIQFDVTDGSGSYIIQANGVTITTASGTSNGTVTANVNNTGLTAGAATITIIDSGDSSCTASINTTIPTCATCTISNVQVTSGPTCNGPNVDMGIQFDVVNGSGNYLLEINGINITLLSGALNGTVSANITNLSIASGGATIKITDNLVNACMSSTTTSFPNCTGTPCLPSAAEIGITYTSNVYVLVQNQITSDMCTVSANVDVTYDADTFILLTNFETAPNATFTAIINGCP